MKLKRTLAVDEEPEVVVRVVLLELLHGDLLSLGHLGGSDCATDLLAEGRWIGRN